MTTTKTACPRCGGSVLQDTARDAPTCINCGWEQLPGVIEAMELQKKAQTHNIHDDVYYGKQGESCTCPKCNKPFKNERGLSIHASKAHTEKPLQVTREYKCHICGAVFDDVHRMAGHTAVHTNHPTEALTILENADKHMKRAIKEQVDPQIQELWKQARLHIVYAINELL